MLFEWDDKKEKANIEKHGIATKREKEAYYCNEENY